MSPSRGGEGSGRYHSGRKIHLFCKYPSATWIYTGVCSLGRWRNPEEVSTVSFTNPLASRSGTFQVRRRTCLVSAIFPNNWQRKIRLRRRVLENHFEVANIFLFQHILSNIKRCGWRVDQYVPPLPTGGSPLKRF